MSTTYSIGQMNQLGDALEAAGFTPDDVTKLRSFSRLGEFKNVLKGHANIVTAKHIVDLDAYPYLPNNWKVEEYTRGGKFEFDPTKIVLYRDLEQLNGGTIVGSKLREKLKGAFNANLLDFYLAHPELIPEEWKGQLVFFWGTIYRSSGGSLYVRYLLWSDDRWYWDYCWLGRSFSDDCPCVVLASSS